MVTNEELHCLCKDYTFYKTQNAAKSAEFQEDYDKLTDIKQTIAKVAMEKHLPVNTLKELLPWLPEIKLEAWEQNQYILLELRTSSNDGTLYTIYFDMYMLMGDTHPRLTIGVSDEKIKIIELSGSDSKINKEITAYMKTVNKVRDEFIKNSKKLLNI